jgi:hypothetical protein
MDSGKAYYTPEEVAEHLNVSTATLKTKIRLRNIGMISLPDGKEGIAAADVQEIMENVVFSQGGEDMTRKE